MSEKLIALFLIKYMIASKVIAFQSSETVEEFSFFKRINIINMTILRIFQSTYNKTINIMNNKLCSV